MKSKTFIEILQEQVDYLQNSGYSYETIYIYLVGDSEPWEFNYEQEFIFDLKNGVLIVKDAGEDAPENVIILSCIAASQLE